MKFSRRKIKPAWTFKTGKKVWRLIPGNGVLAVEFRDTEAKVADYAGIDIASGTPLWQGLRFEESWWVLMNRTFRDVLLLQQFVRPDMPTPGKIFAVDLITGKVLWQNDEMSFLNAAGDLVYGLRKSILSEEVVGLDYRTGTDKITFSTDDPRADEIAFPSAQDDFILPAFIEEITGNLAPAHADRLRKAPPENAMAPTFIPSVNGKNVVGFHTDAGTDEKGIPVFDSHIEILDDEGSVIFGDIADRHVYTAMGDFYFVAEKNLIYARNSTEIVAVKLS